MYSEEIAFFSRFMHARCGMILSKNKAYLLESRLTEVARSMGYAALRDLYLRASQQMTAELEAFLIDALTINETSFFRDRYPFAALRTPSVLSLLQRQEREGWQRIWSAGCASGQEPYSIAMTLLEILPAARIRILATDISTQALERARRGRYSQLEVSRGLPRNVLLQYFHQENGYWRLDEKVKRMVEFRQLNLATPQYKLGSFAVIFCRNVLMYLDPRVRARLIQTLTSSLVPGGYLFLGGTEKVVDDSGELEPCYLGKALCYRRSSPASRTA